jgi:urocanate hydratase
MNQTSIELDFKQQIEQGIPSYLPNYPAAESNINHAPIRIKILSVEEEKLALRNALRYFPSHLHQFLAKEFKEELNTYGRIYMYRYRPTYKMYARNINEYPAKCKQAAAIMLMIQNNLDYAVAQHPHELITYGGNGAVFQNWAQYLLTMQYLSQITEEQTLVMYSGHPMGMFPSHKDAPRVVVTNGMMIPNYSSKNDLEKYNALGVTQYGQMTAGSYMYIGPQGIVHGTCITVMNAMRLVSQRKETEHKTQIFVTCGLGGMSGAQPKATVVAGGICIVAEINTKAVEVRHSQKWVDAVYTNLDLLFEEALNCQKNNIPKSFAFQGNVVDLWEYIVEKNIVIDVGSDQSSLHNPYSGGYYPVGYSFEEGNAMISENPDKFKKEIESTLIRHANAINTLHQRGMYFFDYGNAFLLEASRAGANIVENDGNFKYPSYVQDILGPMCFDYGFGPFRWVCTSGTFDDLYKSDQIALTVLEEMYETAPSEIKGQLYDNIKWIRDARENNLVVGSKARILYADAEGRMKIAVALNKAIANNEISAPIVLGRDHHDVSGTDSPYRETSNIYDGSRYTADMAVHNFVGDAFRGATWISLHNGGGVGWGEVVNGGFGLLLDGTADAQRRATQMLHWDVNNGIARRSWARNKEAQFAINRAMQQEPLLKVTTANIVENNIIEKLYK